MIKKIVAASHEMPKANLTMGQQKTKNSAKKDQRIHWHIGIPKEKEEWAKEIEKAIADTGSNVQDYLMACVAAASPQERLKRLREKIQDAEIAKKRLEDELAKP